MYAQLYIIAALSACALAAPSFAIPSGARPGEMQILSEYFSMLSSKVQAGRSMAASPVCDLSKAVMPIASPTPLPTVTAGLSLKHVAIGRGTQNYTCGSNATAAPVAIGAIATLYNATCIASTYPDLLALLPNLALQFNFSSANQATFSPAQLAISGHHYFQNSTLPTFNLNTAAMNLGFAPCGKNASVPAPSGAPLGQNNVGLGAVAWLKLLTKSTATGDLQEVYRINTAGGSPPATCAGMPAAFEVQYAAEYWFWES